MTWLTRLRDWRAMRRYRREVARIRRDRARSATVAALEENRRWRAMQKRHRKAREAGFRGRAG